MGVLIGLTGMGGGALMTDTADLKRVYTDARAKYLPLIASLNATPWDSIRASTFGT